jgi:hypothetical protein
MLNLESIQTALKVFICFHYFIGRFRKQQNDGKAAVRKKKNEHQNRLKNKLEFRKEKNEYVQLKVPILFHEPQKTHTNSGSMYHCALASMYAIGLLVHFRPNSINNRFTC